MFEKVEEFGPVEESDKKLKFYYNRDERISKAPPLVKEYYNGGLKPVKGFKVLFTGYNKFIFLSLIFFVAFTWIYTGFNKARKYAQISGIQMELSAFVYEEEIYVSLNMKNAPEKIKRGFSNLLPKKKSEPEIPQKIEKAVAAEFFFVEVNNQLCDKCFITDVYEGKEKSIRTKFADYDIIRVDVIVNVDDEEKELSCEVKR
ncbi:MAG: hypothetical protein K6A89_11815 [Treponema sp.]|nr:hypothetical protein [Treponema sp.]